MAEQEARNNPVISSISDFGAEKGRSGLRLRLFIWPIRCPAGDHHLIFILPYFSIFPGKERPFRDYGDRASPPPTSDPHIDDLVMSIFW